MIITMMTMTTVTMMMIMIMLMLMLMIMIVLMTMIMIIKMINNIYILLITCSSLALHILDAKQAWLFVSDRVKRNQQQKQRLPFLH